MLRSEAALGGGIRLATVREAHVAREGGFPEASKHAQVRLEQAEQTLRPILVHVTTGVFLPCVIDELVEIALQRLIAARRVRVEPTARLDGEVCGLLHCFHGEIFGRLDDHSPLATDPGDDRGPVFVIMAAPGLAFFAAATWPAPQGLCATMFGLAFLPGSVIEVIRFYCTRHLAIGFVGDSRIAQPPAPAIARTAMHPQLSRNTPR